MSVIRSARLDQSSSIGQPDTDNLQPPGVVVKMFPWWFKWTVIGGISTFLLLYRRYVSSRRMYAKFTPMTGKTVIITGGNSGLGTATALELARRGARVILACRNIEKAKLAAHDIISQTRNKEVLVKQVDLASFASVRTFCQTIKKEETKIDVLINNAGIYQCPFAKSEDGIEMHLAVNHFGHFLMTGLLLDLLIKSAPSRIVVVTSMLHRHGKLDFTDINHEVSYDKAKAYADSKLANVYFARELSHRLEGTGVTVYCIHPGIVMTNLSRHVTSRFVIKYVQPLLALLGLKTAHEGCQTIVYCSCEESVSKESGCFYGDCRQKPWQPAALDDASSQKLWEISEYLTGINIPQENPARK